MRRAVLVLGIVLGVACALTAQQPRMLLETLPADAEPIQLNADNVATWKEAGQQVFLLRGNVVVGQGTTAVRAEDIVVWVDTQGFQTEQVFRALVYGDKAISLDSGAKGKAEAEFGFVRLTTSSKVNIKAFKNTAVQQNLSSDPVYQRALAQIARTRATTLDRRDRGAEGGCECASGLGLTTAARAAAAATLPRRPRRRRSSIRKLDRALRPWRRPRICNPRWSRRSSRCLALAEWGRPFHRERSCRRRRRPSFPASRKHGRRRGSTFGLAIGTISRSSASRSRTA